MRRLGAVRWVAVVAALCGGCFPVTRKDVVFDRTVATRVKRDPPNKSALTGKVATRAGGVDVTLTKVSYCRERTVKTVDRRITHKRTGWTGSIAAEGFLGVAGAGAGGLLLYENRAGSGNSTGGPDWTRNPQIDEAGIGVGAALLVDMIVEAVRLHDTVSHHAGIQVVEPRRTREVACGRAPAKGRRVELVVAGGYKPVPLGVTDAKGSLHAGWKALPAQLLDGAHPPTAGAVVVAPPAGVRGASPQRIGKVSLTGARVAIAAAAWKAARAAGTAAAVVTFRKRFPDLHPKAAADLQQKIEAGGHFEAQVKAAIAAKQIAEAERLMTRWQQADAHDPAQAPLRAEIAALSSAAAQSAAAWQAYRNRVEAAKHNLVSASEMNALDGELTRLLKQDPNHGNADALRAELVALRHDLAKRLVAAAKPQQRSAPEVALTLLTRASAVDPDAPEPARLLARVRRELARKARAQARKLERQRRFAEAEDVLEHAQSLAPKSRRLARERARMGKKMARAATRQVREAAAKQRRAAREAARHAAAAAARQKRAQERAAAAKRRTARKAARQAAAQAARERRAQERAAAKQRRAAREAAAAARRRARALARTRRHAGSVGGGAGARAKTAAAGRPQRLVLRVAPRYARADILAHVPVPRSCRAVVGSFRAKRPSCPRCGPVAMRRVRMSCTGGARLQLIKDQANVWATCWRTSCGQCLAAVRSLLAPFSGKHGRSTRLVYSCRQRSAKPPR